MTSEDVGEFEERRSRVEKVRKRREQLGSVLPSFLVDRLYPPETVEEFERRRNEAEETFEECREELVQLTERISSRIQEAEAGVDPFDVDLTSLRIRLDRAVDTADRLTEVDGAYLTAEEHEEREELLDRVQAVERWLDAYENVGQELAAAEHHLGEAEDLLSTFGLDEWTPAEADAPPATTLPRYMTRQTRRSCARELAETARRVETCYEQVRDAGLTDRYLDDVDEVRDRRRQLDRFLAAYDDWFLEQEKQQHRDLFTDIDAAGHDLSDEQQAAVVRDDKYNLVVAGAGSGKTVTLAHRAAYLDRRDDRVLPSHVLAITYTKNAAEVMESRLSSRFGITDATVGTFHSVGRNVIVEEEERRPEIITEHDRRGLIRRFLREERKRSDSPLQREFVRFLRHYYDSTEDASVEEKAEAVDDRDELTTLRGETVRSESEKRIADFLFARGVEYEHRLVLDWFEDVPGAGQYNPTFYLPEFDVVISHHPVDTAGRPVEWADAETREEYRYFVEWERKRLAERPSTDLVETYEFEHTAYGLAPALEERLPKAGVLFEDESLLDLVEKAYDESVNRYQVVSLFDSFITNAKQLNLTPDEVDERVADAETPKRDAFGECASRLFRRYEVELRDIGAIDFPDMLHKAADYMEANPEKYANRYQQVLVDEFQDISAAEVRLLKCFVTPDSDTHLFCVGDDWQSIYSFSGSDVGYFIDFADYFAEPTRSDLTANYRCPETVVAAGDTLIANNDRQLEKETRPKSGTDTDIHVHDLEASPEDRTYRHELVEQAAALIERSLEDGRPPDEVMVLSRSKVFYNDLEEVCAERGIKASTNPENEDVPEEYVRLYSVHKSKGDEAEHVIIIHAVEDYVGFPSQVEDSDLLDPVRVAPEAEASEAEERRLFYVALTRTTGDLDIVSSRGNRSRFLDEIEDHLTVAPTVTALGDHDQRTDLGEVTIDRLFDAKGPVEQVGLLTDWSGTRKFTIFDADETELLDADERYRIENARIDEYEGSYSFVLDERTRVHEVDQVDTERSAATKLE